MSESTGWAVFLIQGRNLSTEQLESALHMKPDFLREGRDGMRHWQLNSRLSGRHSINEHVEDLLKRLLPVRKAVRSLPAGLEARFICSVITRNISRGSFELPGNLLLLIGSLQCVLEVHFDVTED
ncbi:DUF4279 domain-containing protein [Leptonema illini]|jgi:hypothetical protein|uniref:DUF4279 domain-containing protein n=1 Tax=Leptonema illini DSM 21528 TaxID=929563 RepID=H2CLE7_9LEPT|nr:DUF4279 domain-containing protein [Leptonema illini]EHQ04558.1 hypothetical protein Lepil_4080 [Leptonema illini DSM 21528]